MTLSELHVPPTANCGVVTIGNFDGVHRGHQEMLSVVRNAARKHDAPAVVVTFDPHPVNILRPDVNLPRLSEISTRIKLLKRYGADEVVVLPVTHQLLQMTPGQFFDDIILRRLGAVSLVEGPDFRFGRDRTGDTSVLQRLCDAGGVGLEIIPAVCRSNRMISSTIIRGHVGAGDIADAVQLLGHCYEIGGVVMSGAQRGRELGFPTANLGNVGVMLPENGVYAGVYRKGQSAYPVAISIGPNPTFGVGERKVECHIIGFSGDLYNQRISIEMISRVRALVAFDSPEQLVTQIQDDIESCKALSGINN